MSTVDRRHRRMAKASRKAGGVERSQAEQRGEAQARAPRQNLALNDRIAPIAGWVGSEHHVASGCHAHAPLAEKQAPVPAVERGAAVCPTKEVKLKCHQRP